MPHIVLLGDSIFDNRAYVGGGPDLVAQLRGDLPAGWTASLGAVDGAVIADVARQVQAFPAEATHLVVSVGGNDGLRESGILESRVGSVAVALLVLAAVGERFERAYRTMLPPCWSGGCRRRCARSTTRPIRTRPGSA